MGTLNVFIKMLSILNKSTIKGVFAIDFSRYYLTISYWLSQINNAVVALYHPPPTIHNMFALSMALARTTANIPACVCALVFDEAQSYQTIQSLLPSICLHVLFIQHFHSSFYHACLTLLRQFISQHLHCFDFDVPFRTSCMHGHKWLMRTPQYW